jgi:hypothetical protein
MGTLWFLSLFLSVSTSSELRHRSWFEPSFCLNLDFLDVGWSWWWKRGGKIRPYWRVMKTRNEVAASCKIRDQLCLRTFWALEVCDTLITNSLLLLNRRFVLFCSESPAEIQHRSFWLSFSWGSEFWGTNLLGSNSGGCYNTVNLMEVWRWLNKFWFRASPVVLSMWPCERKYFSHPSPQIETAPIFQPMWCLRSDWRVPAAMATVQPQAPTLIMPLV